jgi:hypothetical protein
MNTVQIEMTIYVLQGVFGSYCLPTEPILLVCNIDSHHRPGEQWIYINVDVEITLFSFDTDTFKTLPDEHHRAWMFNK